MAERPYVEGSGADPHGEVWVVVHPTEVSEYWVQPHATIKEDGTWKTKIHIGRPGDSDVGKDFEIRAFAKPEPSLKVGQRLEQWPQAQQRSQVVEVSRE